MPNTLLPGVSKSAPLWVQRVTAAIGILVGAKALLISGLPGASPEIKLLLGQWFDYVSGVVSIGFSLLLILMGDSQDCTPAIKAGATTLVLFMGIMLVSSCKTKPPANNIPVSLNSVQPILILKPDTAKGIPYAKPDTGSIYTGDTSSKTQVQVYGDSTVVTHWYWINLYRFITKPAQYFYITYPDVLKRDSLLALQNDSLRKACLKTSMTQSTSKSSGLPSWVWAIIGSIVTGIGTALTNKGKKSNS
jgi:hypothetical protein